MKLVAVSVVKNEADIIEAFVRHTHAWVDAHLVFDHASTDGTRETLFQLVAEGLPLRLYTDDALGNLQQARSNHLTRLAASEFGADWVLPLDADEFIAAPARAALEQALGDPVGGAPVRVPMINYYPSREDDAAEPNPVLRLRHCERHPGPSHKVFLPAALAADPTVETGKGSHAVYRDGAAVSDRPAPAGIHLAHFALRSLGQQALRVVTAELQKLGRGRAHEGLDVHYRLGFQLLAEDPAGFAASLFARPESLERRPLDYRGGPLRHAAVADDWKRVALALLPFLERLARSHGELVDRLPAGTDTTSVPRAPAIRPLEPMPAAVPLAEAEAFGGFVVEDGLQPPEGPFPGAFLPRIRWGTAPATRLVIDSPQARPGWLRLDAVAYLENQEIMIALNGTQLHALGFPRVNQKERLDLPLALRAGVNLLELRYARAYSSAQDPRQLAVIFLGLRVL